MTLGGNLLSGFSRGSHCPILALITRSVDLPACEEEEVRSSEQSKHRAGGASILPKLLVQQLPATYRGIGSPGVEVTAVVNFPHGTWELNPCPPKEQHGFLTTEPSPAPDVCSHLCPLV